MTKGTARQREALAALIIHTKKIAIGRNGKGVPSHFHPDLPSQKGATPGIWKSAERMLQTV